MKQIIKSHIVTDRTSQARLVSMLAGGNGSLHCLAGMSMFTDIAGIANSYRVEGHSKVNYYRQQYVALSIFVAENFPL